jgi:hypothetical protein
LLQGCVYDPDEPCGPHQESIGFDSCACVDGYVLGDAGCEPCGEHERSSHGECVCVDGFARAAAGEACSPIPAELGATCHTDDDCGDSPFPTCHVTEAGDGYCTKLCTSDDDCEGGYRCHDAGDESYCRRPPTGYGDACQSNDDCSGEASFCETLQSHLCLVPCSAGKTEVCFEGEVCCDFVFFEPICVPADACTSKSGTEVP